MEIDFTPWDKEYDEARANLDPLLEGLSEDDRAKKIAAFEKEAERRRKDFVENATTKAMAEELMALARRYDRVLEAFVYRSARTRGLYFNEHDLGPNYLASVVRAGIIDFAAKSVAHMEAKEQEQGEND